MISITLPLLGQVHFEESEDDRWDCEVQSPVGDFSVDFHVEGGGLTAALLDKARPMLENTVALDADARTAIRADYAEGEGARSYEFLEFHVEELPPDELDKCFGSHEPEDIGIEQLLAALKLKRIGFYLDNDEEFAIMDYMLADAESDQIVVVYVNAAGQVQSVQMES